MTPPDLAEIERLEAMASSLAIAIRKITPQDAYQTMRPKRWAWSLRTASDNARNALNFLQEARWQIERDAAIAARKETHDARV